MNVYTIVEAGVNHNVDMQMAPKGLWLLQIYKAKNAFTEMNLTTKRPGDGISPMKWNEIIGTVADWDYGVDEKIEI